MELKLKNCYKYAGDIFNALVEKAGFPLDVATEFCNGIKDAKVVEQEHGRWIPVTERLPEICENVIVYVVYHSSRHVTVIRSVVPAYYTEDGFWMYGNGIRLQNVTHWMPLPDAPEEEENV